MSRPATSDPGPVGDVEAAISVLRKAEREVMYEATRGGVTFKTALAAEDAERALLASVAAAVERAREEGRREAERAHACEANGAGGGE